MEISIVIAEKNDLLRELLVRLLENQAGVRIAGTSRDAAETERLLKELAPNLAIVDVHLDDFNVGDAFHRISEESPGTKLLAFSNRASSQFAEKTMQAGASGYLLKDCAFEELTTAVQRVIQNKIYISPRIRERVRQR